MTLAIMPPEWVADAVCGQTDPEVFFPEKGGNSARQAKAICAECPVLDQCREYALAQDAMSLHGVWGGTTQDERRKIRAGLGLNVKQLQPCGTRAAYNRHLAAGEEPCEDCTRANFNYHAQRDGRAARPQTEHGTTRGYRQHRRLGTTTCVECRKAWAEYCNRRGEVA